MLSPAKSWFRAAVFPALFLKLAVVASAAGPLKIALAGDSTVCKYPKESRQRGWGELLPEYLASGVEVINEAKGGASTKTFPPERWTRVLEARPDFVLIQFGHNDSHAKGNPESTDAATDFRENLRRYIGEVRAVGVTPVLVTPVRRRLFADGAPTEELTPYAEATRAVAAETGVALVDLHARSGELYARLGEEATTGYTMNQKDGADRPGQGDRTHFTEEGARVIAGLVAEELRGVDPRLGAALKSSAPKR